MNRNTVKDIKASYERLKVGKTGLRLKLLKEVARTMYEAVQDAKNN